jgi:hypothetical protein
MFETIMKNINLFDKNLCLDSSYKKLQFLFQMDLKQLQLFLETLKKNVNFVGRI